MQWYYQLAMYLYQHAPLGFLPSASTNGDIIIITSIYMNDWINNLQNKKQSKTNEPPQLIPAQSKDKPSKCDYLVSTNKVEHNQMAERLIQVGNLPNEAEQIISMRNSAF
jgi:hypothetical protein